jgi:hypothetical protein
MPKFPDVRKQGYPNLEHPVYPGGIPGIFVTVWAASPARANATTGKSGPHT